MTATGIEIRTRALERYPALGVQPFPLGKTDGVGTTSYLNDGIRQKMSTLSPAAGGDAYLRATQAASGTASGSAATTLTDATAPFVASGLIGAVVQAATAAGVLTYMVITSNTTSVLTGASWNNGTPSSTSAYVVSFGYVGKLTRRDPANGYLYVSPVFPAVTGAGVAYELWGMGIAPDDADRARDRALEERCSNWRPMPLSVLPDVTAWSTSAYSSTAGGETDAAATVQTMDFPHEYFQQSMLVTNSGADGYEASPSYYVQDGDRYRVVGWVSTRAQTASVRARDITNTADITISETATFTLRGWLYFELTFTVPTGCQEVQLWLGGASASCIAEWAGVGLLPVGAEVFTLPARVRSKNDVGCVYARTGPTGTNQGSAATPELVEIGCDREFSAARVKLTFPGGLPDCGVFWDERHYYTALQTAYMTATDRVTGDTASTDCPIEYVTAAMVCELLEGRAQTEELQAVLLRATMDLAAWDEQLGPEPKQPEVTTRPSPYLSRV